MKFLGWTDAIFGSFPTPDRLLDAPEIELERALLNIVADATDDQMRRMATRDSIVNELFRFGGYDHRKKDPVQKAINRAWRTLEASNLIEEPDPDNGKNGYRVISEEGRAALRQIDLEAAKMRNKFEAVMVHLLLREAAWRAFKAGDYDTAVYEAFKVVESAVRKKNASLVTEHGVRLMEKAFDPIAGPLKATDPRRAKARQNLFMGAMGDLRNPRAHGDPTITDPLVAMEELMVASALLRIVGA